jgi:hypothetical protein
MIKRRTTIAYDTSRYVRCIYLVPVYYTIMYTGTGTGGSSITYRISYQVTKNKKIIHEQS